MDYSDFLHKQKRDPKDFSRPLTIHLGEDECGNLLTFSLYLEVDT